MQANELQEKIKEIYRYKKRDPKVIREIFVKHFPHMGITETIENVIEYIAAGVAPPKGTKEFTSALNLLEHILGLQPASMFMPFILNMYYTFMLDKKYLYLVSVADTIVLRYINNYVFDNHFKISREEKETILYVVIECLRNNESDIDYYINYVDILSILLDEELSSEDRKYMHEMDEMYQTSGYYLRKHDFEQAWRKADLYLKDEQFKYLKSFYEKQHE